jgi:predicted Ser/Thr protein kinase
MPTGYTQTTLKTLNGNSVYKKNGTGTYYTIPAVGAAKKVALTTSVKNASGEQLVLGNHGKFNATNLTTGYSGQKVYKKVGVDSYYVKSNAGTMITFSSAATVKNSAGKSMTLSEYKKKSGATPKPKPAAPVPNIPTGFTKTNLKVEAHTGSLKNVYKKNSNGTYHALLPNGAIFKLPDGLTIVKPNGTKVKVSNLMEAQIANGYTKTNLKMGASNVGFKNIYHKNGKYYTTVPSGKMINLPNYAKLTKPNGSKISIKNLKSGAGPSAPPAAKTPPGYTKTNMKWEIATGNSRQIYVKNGKYYTKMTSGTMFEVLSTMKLTKPNGSKVKVADLKSAAAPPAANNGYKKTNLKGVNSTNIYIKNGKYYKKYPTGEFFNLLPTTIVSKPNGAYVSVNNLMKGAGPSAPPAAKTPAAGPFVGWTNTGKLSNNGKKVYKSNSGEFMVVKNGKISKTFKGKAKLLQQQTVASLMAPAPAPEPAGIAPVVAVSLVPVIKPGPDHVKAVETKYVNSVTKVAEKLKELHEVTGKNNTKNLNNYVAKRGNTGFAHMNRTNTITYRTTTVSGFQGGGGGWRKSLEKPHFVYNTRKVSLKYTQYLAHKQLLFVYGKNVNSFENVRISDIIDTKWLVAQDKYIRSLSARQLFTMYGYSYNGDSWAHAYLDGRFNFSLFKTAVPGPTSNNYFAFFFQARDYYKINTGDINKDYKAVVDRVRVESDVKNIENIMNMFINELNEIIRKAPAVTRTFIVFRGQKDDKYMSGMIGNTYTAERFCSTSVDGTVSKDRFSSGHTLQRITVLRGSKCLLMFGVTKFDDELEILLPRGSTYQIVKKRANVKSDKSTNLLNPAAYPDSIQNLVDIVLIGTVEDAPVTAPVPVTVIPQTNVNIMQNILKKQPGWGTAKVTGLIGKGGYGAVYQASNNNLGNVAVKIQKKTNNSNAEAKALKKLKYTGIAPNYYSERLIKASNNVAKLVPRGIAPGNNVSIIMSEMIRGNPLSKWYTGAPIPQNIKNKVTNVVKNMHSVGIIHGDLHKNNIIIGNNGKAYVIDFGKSLTTNKNFKTTNEANNYIKKLTGKTKTSHSKVSWYSDNKRTHFLNGNFLKRMK